MRHLAFLLLASVVLVSVVSFAAEEQEPIEIPKDVPSSHEEGEPLKIEFKRLSSLCYHPKGYLLASDSEAEEIKVIDAGGTVTKTLEPGFGVYALDVAPDGTIYCGGMDKLAMLDPSGKVLKTVEVVEEFKKPSEDQPATSPRHGSHKPRVSGIAIAGDDIFVAFGSGWSMRSRSKLYRYDRKLENPTMVAKNLRGCCQRCDVAAFDGVFYLAENCAYRVVGFDREGKELEKWGKRDRKDIEGFGACCNPMNVCFDAKGNLYTAESGMGRVKCYTRDGKFLGLVGYIDVDRFERASGFAASCSNIAIAATPDAGRVYVMDYRNNLIRVLVKK